jgi:hypothetical protein
MEELFMYTVSSETSSFQSRRFLWSAVLAGVVISLAVGALLNLLGLGFGLGFMGFPDKEAIASVSIVSMMWMMLTGILSLLAGGWIAGRFAYTDCRFEGAWYGLATWAVAGLITFALMVTTVGSIISGTATLVGHTVSAVGQTAAAVGKGAAQMGPQVAETAKKTLPDLTSAMSDIRQQAEEVLSKASESKDKDKLKEQLGKSIKSWLSAETEDDRAAAQKRLVEFLTTNANMTEYKARSTVKQWEEKYESLKNEAKEKAEQAAKKATDMLGAVALFVAFSSLLSAIAGAFGGAVGVKSTKKKYKSDNQR